MENTNQIQTTSSNQQFNLAPTSFNQLMDFANIVSNSGMVPKDYKGNPGNIIVAVQMGVEIGLKPMQALQNISVINGRPSVWGDALLAIVKNSSVCEYIHESYSPDGLTAICKVKRKKEDEQIRTFSKQDAANAGLLGRDTYQKYLRRMLQFRARAWALRDVFPDILLGMQVTEEMEDLEYTQQRTVEAAPKTLEQLGLSCKEEDGKLIVVGNTYGKTDTLKDLGFIFKDKIWFKDLPITQEDVIEAETITTTETQSVTPVPEAQPQPVETAAEATQAPVDSQPVEAKEVKKVENTFSIPETKEEHLQFISGLGLNCVVETERGKTMLIVTESVEELNDLQKASLKSIGFKNSKTRGLYKNITDLVVTSDEVKTIPVEVEVVKAETQETQVSQTNEVPVEYVSEKTPFDEGFQEGTQSTQHTDELPFD